jgi:hypothetical protein
MRKDRPSLRRSATLVLSAGLLLAAFGGRAEAASSSTLPALTLRANRAIAEPGGVFAMVLRTYAARPIRQGQISVGVTTTTKRAVLRKSGGSGSSTTVTPPPPNATLLQCIVFSVSGDAQTQTSGGYTSTGTKTALQFKSASGSVNAADGPLAVLFFQLDPSAVPGQKLTLHIDPKSTSMVDADGYQVTLDPRDGVLEVRAPGDPKTLGTDGGTVPAGGLATLAAQTFEPFPLSAGQIALRYDPTLFASDPVVRMDPRYGTSSFTVDSSTPGLLVVNFVSSDGTLNTVPGSLVAVDLTVAPDAVTGTVSPVTVDPDLSWLVDAQGGKVPLTLETGAITIH